MQETPLFRLLTRSTSEGSESVPGMTVRLWYIIFAWWLFLLTVLIINIYHYASALTGKP